MQPESDTTTSRTTAFSVARVEVKDILTLRESHRRDMRCQIVHDSFAERGLSDAYLIEAGGRTVGYGLVANKYDADTVDEFYLVPEQRGVALPIFTQLLHVSQAKRIRAQTNDSLLLLMLFDCATNLASDTILFADAFTTSLTCPEGALTPSTTPDRWDWQIESAGAAVATGGLLFHYNPPYGDIFMEVDPAYRRRGFGSFLVQELKRICYEQGHVPAARCNARNVASRKTMEKAGMLPCGRIVLGDVVKEGAVLQSSP